MYTIHTYMYLHTYHTYIKGPTQSHNRIITIRPCPKRLATAHSPLPKEAHHGSQQISSFNCLLFLALKDLLSANKRTRALVIQSAVGQEPIRFLDD